ncbi:hypothetical protein FACS189426_09450 [Bacteroidia bacterium]|nr:hypothetical protein FACS189426_09450 [Bacteroidia bacterium]
MLDSLLALAPMFVCLFWVVTLLFDVTNRSRAQGVLILFMTVGGIQLLGQAIFNHHDYWLTAVYDPIYASATSFLYPLYYQYVRSLTLPKGRSLKSWWFMFPSVVISLMNITLFFLTSAEELRIYSHAVLYGEEGFTLPLLVVLQKWNANTLYILFDIQGILALWHGLKLFKQYRQRLSEYYSDPDERMIASLKFLQYSFVFSFVGSTTFCSIGRISFIQSTGWLFVASIGHAVIFYLIGFVGIQQRFTVDDMERDVIKSDHEEETSFLSDVRSLKSQIIALLEKEELFRQADLSISDVAFRLHTNRAYISRTLNQDLQTSFSDFVNKYRVEYAKKLLLSAEHSKASIISIAEAAGFSHLSSFYRVFKSIEGVSPKEWQKKLR